MPMAGHERTWANCKSVRARHDSSSRITGTGSEFDREGGEKEQIERRERERGGGKSSNRGARSMSIEEHSTSQKAANVRDLARVSPTAKREKHKRTERTRTVSEGISQNEI